MIILDLFTIFLVFSDHVDNHFESNILLYCCSLELALIVANKITSNASTVFKNYITFN